MNIRITPRLASFVALGLLAAFATVLILWATPEGLGLSDDSIGYIAGARSMIAGHGYREAWLASNGPVTHFPPAFLASLACRRSSSLLALLSGSFHRSPQAASPSHV